ncbi:hypothetical protein AVEN_149053-1 [Araneus ventricosus]|uniref:Uncharacterized protein n=1 Tax=Araneus ventricosus TaxID=182803 RepID=A0A4Y2LLK4_ARAVE|nr:hypothetical protein AVEN_127549-1 [Araneus ventricosus]GBN15767.1 hypothetical protein AVEN_149053-1 [Araneus ventricosus]
MNHYQHNSGEATNSVEYCTVEAKDDDVHGTTGMSDWKDGLGSGVMGESRAAEQLQVGNRQSTGELQLEIQMRTCRWRSTELLEG